MPKTSKKQQTILALLQIAFRPVDDGVDGLVSLIAHPEMDVRENVIRKLREVGRLGISRLAVAAVSNEDEVLRLHAVYLLGKLGRHFPTQAESALNEVAQTDNNPMFNRMLIKAFQSLGVEVPSEVASRDTGYRLPEP
jgi:hypothetical protein